MIKPQTLVFQTSTTNVERVKLLSLRLMYRSRNYYKGCTDEAHRFGSMRFAHSLSSVVSSTGGRMIKPKFEVKEIEKQVFTENSRKPVFSAVPERHSKFTLTSNELSAIATLSKLIECTDVAIAAAAEEGWNIRSHSLYIQLLNKFEMLCIQELSSDTLINAVRVLVKFRGCNIKRNILEKIVLRFLSLDFSSSSPLTPSKLSEIILLLYKGGIKRLEILNWLKEKIMAFSNDVVIRDGVAPSAAAGVFSCFPSSEVFDVISALDRLFPGVFKSEIKQFREFTLNSLISISDFNESMNQIKNLIPTGFLNTHTIITIRERFLDVAHSFTPHQRVTLFATCARLRLFSWNSVRSLLFPDWGVLEIMNSNLLTEVRKLFSVLLNEESVERVPSYYSAVGSRSA